MKVKIVALVVLSLVGVSMVSGQNKAGQQQSSNSQQEIEGGGTANYITKFTGRNKVGNSALFENGPNVITYDNFSAANVTGTVNGPLSVAVTGINNTQDGDTSLDAFYASGLVGVLGQSVSPASAAVEGMANSPTGDPVGVFGKTASSDRGIGVRGQAVGATGGGIGVLGEALSPNGNAGLFNHMSSTGYPIALFGYSGSTDGGEGVHGRTNATTGLGIGVNGDTFSFDGFGGSFTNFAGGNILRGVNNATVVFRVDGNGTLFANGGLQPGGADFAEEMNVSGDRTKYAAGDLLVLDAAAERKLSLSQEPYSTLVAGIYSTKPGMLGSTRTVNEKAGTDTVPLAVVGIVPCKVSAENGAIHPGDLLVTSSLRGHAMKGTDRQRMLGAVVGKALGSLEGGSGVIQVLVTLQ